MSTIPASAIVQSIPGVVTAGGTAVSLNGLFLTTNTRAPINTVLSLASAAAVSSYFGATSNEYAEAQVYFAGYTGCTTYPGAMLFSQYPGSSTACSFTGTISTTTLTVSAVADGALAVGQIISGTGVTADTLITALGTGTGGVGTYTISVSQTVGSATAMTASSPGVAAYIRGASLAALGLAGIQAITAGALTITADGYPHAVSSLNLSSASSFSNAASLINTAITGASNPNIATFSSASISGNVLTVTTLASGTVAPGQTVIGGSTTAGTIILAQLTGTTGGTGTYAVNISQSNTPTGTVGTLPTVSYDTIGGGFVITSGVTGAASQMAYVSGSSAATLLLTSATGAVLSQGAAATTPSAFMTNLVTISQNWACFTHIFDPDAGVGNTLKLGFAAWTSAQTNRYLYVPWDTDQSPVNNNPATGSLGYLCGPNGNNYSGIAPLSQATNLHGASFVLGYAASLNFNAVNGRANAAFRNQAGLAAGVTSLTPSTNLQANGYNFVGAYGTANSTLIFVYPGSVVGPFAFIDSFVNQIWLNANLQSSILNAFTQFPSFPYNQDGYSLIEAAIMNVMALFVQFGGCHSGVNLSATEIAYVNSTTGKNIAPTLQQQGWAVVISDPGAAARAARQTPICTLLYVDGQSVNSLTISSLLVQ